MKMNISFQPDGKYFVFDDNGKTLKKDLPTKRDAQNWLLWRMLGVK